VNQHSRWTAGRRLAAAAGGLIVMLLGLAGAPATAAQQAPYGSYQQSCRDIRVETLLGGLGANIVAWCRTVDGRYVKSSLPLDCDGDIANDNGQLRCIGSTPSNRPPYGSYQQTCYGAYMTGPILHATCRDRSGRANQTALNVLNCKSDISNQNGQLRCGGGADQPPSGSYQQSCVGAYMTGPVLHATCRDMSGRNQQSEINVLGCRGDIANINGRLACPGGGFGPVQIFAAPNWRGASRSINQAVPDLRAIGFNNMIQSITVATGAWEFCTAPYYSGRCYRLTTGVANLSQFGLANSISSIRPVR